jgi:drug/metabolite transporter (DMT)-like permease
MTGWLHLEPLLAVILWGGIYPGVKLGLCDIPLRWTTASNSAILLATAPLLTVGWFACTGREQPGRRQWLGLVLGFVGVGLIVQGGGPDGAWFPLGGGLLALGAAGAWAWYGVATVGAGLTFAGVGLASYR